jgi:hypothetical protein
MNWGYSRTSEGFLDVVYSGRYASYEPPGIFDIFANLINQLGRFAADTANGFGWPYLLFCILPIFALIHIGRRARRWLLAQVAMFLCAGPVILAPFHPSAESAVYDLIRPHFIPMYIILAVWTGLGLMLVGSRIAKPCLTP